MPDSVLNRKKSAFPYYGNPYYARVINERVQELVTSGSPAFDALDRGYFEKLLKVGVTNIDRYVCEKLIQVDAWIREYHIHLV